MPTLTHVPTSNPAWEPLVNHYPMELVGDILGPLEEDSLPRRDMDGLGEGKRLIERYADARIGAVQRFFGDRRPGVLLSGGVDSSWVTAELVRAGLNPLCVTAGVADNDTADFPRASATAAALGAELVEVRLIDGDIANLAREATARLGVDEVYEVGAAITLSAGLEAARERGIEGPMYTGNGADFWFHGGRVPRAPVQSDAARTETAAGIWDHAIRGLTSNRLVPDFFERVLGQDHSRLICTWSTLAGRHATCRFGPPVLFGTGPDGIVDKLCLRDRAADLGVPSESARAGHDPMQASNGLLSAFSRLGREFLWRDPSSRAYSDPRVEPADMVIARGWLKQLADDR